MPRFDGTGPWGLGPCGAGMAWRRSWSRGREFGWRRFWRYGPEDNPYQPPITKQEEKEILEREVRNLEKELKVIKTRLAELDDRDEVS